MSGRTATGDPPRDIHEETRKVASLINAASGLLAEGKMVDLAGLQRNVDTLCQALRQVPPKEGQAARETIASLLDGLDTLAEALTAQYQDITCRLEGAVRRQAAAAYDRSRDDA
ncbi:MAG: hypothetical protein QGI06_06190 [Rhodospirillales bacterium]|jgi:hypothetical protein|nr:hypothetical protein [Rhodospirillales bacterium]